MALLLGVWLLLSEVILAPLHPRRGWEWFRHCLRLARVFGGCDADRSGAKAVPIAVPVGDDRLGQLRSAGGHPPSPKCSLRETVLPDELVVWDSARCVLPNHDAARASVSERNHLRGGGCPGRERTPRTPLARMDCVRTPRRSARSDYGNSFARCCPRAWDRACVSHHLQQTTLARCGAAPGGTKRHWFRGTCVAVGLEQRVATRRAGMRLVADRISVVATTRQLVRGVEPFGAGPGNSRSVRKPSLGQRAQSTFGKQLCGTCRKPGPWRSGDYRRCHPPSHRSQPDAEASARRIGCAVHDAYRDCRLQRHRGAFLDTRPYRPIPYRHVHRSRVCGE